MKLLQIATLAAMIGSQEDHMSQNTAILMHLKSGRFITPLQALDQFGCFRLAARIKELKESGHRIASSKVQVSDGKYVSQYWMKR
jgi:hypothetical protein